MSTFRDAHAVLNKIGDEAGYTSAHADHEFFIHECRQKHAEFCAAFPDSKMDIGEFCEEFGADIKKGLRARARVGASALTKGVEGGNAPIAPVASVAPVMQVAAPAPSVSFANNDFDEAERITSSINALVGNIIRNREASPDELVAAVSRSVGDNAYLASLVNAAIDAVACDRAIGARPPAQIRRYLKTAQSIDAGAHNNAFLNACASYISEAIESGHVQTDHMVVLAPAVMGEGTKSWWSTASSAQKERYVAAHVVVGVDEERKTVTTATGDKYTLAFGGANTLLTGPPVGSRATSTHVADPFKIQLCASTLTVLPIKAEMQDIGAHASIDRAFSSDAQNENVDFRIWGFGKKKKTTPGLAEAAPRSVRDILAGNPNKWILRSCNPTKDDQWALFVPSTELARSGPLITAITAFAVKNGSSVTPLLQDAGGVAQTLSVIVRTDVLEVAEIERTFALNVKDAYSRTHRPPGSAFPSTEEAAAEDAAYKAELTRLEAAKDLTLRLKPLARAVLAKIASVHLSSDPNAVIDEWVASTASGKRAEIATLSTIMLYSRAAKDTSGADVFNVYDKDTNQEMASISPTTQAEKAVDGIVYTVKEFFPLYIHGIVQELIKYLQVAQPEKGALLEQQYTKVPENPRRKSTAPSVVPPPEVPATPKLKLSAVPPLPSQLRSSSRGREQTAITQP
jgi:hypothetical protein